MEPRRVSDLTPSEQQDFRVQMRWAVLEGAQLQEVAPGSVDRLPQGDVTHGPWQPADCSAYLVRCFHAGLVAVRNAGDLRLGDAETLALLEAPQRWTEHDTRHWCLTPGHDDEQDDAAAWPPVLPVSEQGS